MKILIPDLAMAQRFLDYLDPQGSFTFQMFYDAADPNWRLAKVLHGTLEQHKDAMVQYNQAGAGVFVMVNRGDGFIHTGSKTCRTNNNVTAVRALFADADGVPIDSVLAKSPPAHILVESSLGKWHLYWLTKDTPLDEFSQRQLAIANCLGTDPAVKDLARVLRVPGFYHQKGKPFMSRLVEEGRFI